MADLYALLALLGIIVVFGFLPWRITAYIHGGTFFPRVRFPLSQRAAVQQEASIQVPGTTQEAQGEVVQIGQQFNLKELEQSERVWSIVLAGLVHHLYYVYNTVEQESIARDRYVSHGHFTSTEFEYLIGPENPGKQAQPGLLRRAGLVVTDRGEGQIVRTILPIADPAQAIVVLFKYLERMEQEAREDTREIVSIAGNSYMVPGDSGEGEEGFEY